ncbi:MAG: SPOR domain-containing protein [Crinalium sp.]
MADIFVVKESDGTFAIAKLSGYSQVIAPFGDRQQAEEYLAELDHQTGFVVQDGNDPAVFRVVSGATKIASPFECQEDAENFKSRLKCFGWTYDPYYVDKAHENANDYGVFTDPLSKGYCVGTDEDFVCLDAVELSHDMWAIHAVLDGEHHTQDFDYVIARKKEILLAVENLIDRACEWATENELQNFSNDCYPVIGDIAEKAYGFKNCMVNSEKANAWAKRRFGVSENKFGAYWDNGYVLTAYFTRNKKPLKHTWE